MKIEEIRGKTEHELAFELEKMKKDLFGTRFKRATETSANPAKIRTLRRSIARVNTVLLERRRAASQAQTAPAARATAKSGRK